MDFCTYAIRPIVVFSLALLCSMPSSVLAQEAGADAEESTPDAPVEDETNGIDEDGYVTPTDKQTALNTSAVEAIKSEEYEQAVALLRRSLELGEMNITYLNLGRAHQRLAECGSAEDAYLAAVSAPPVRSPSPYLIEKKVEQYMEELEAECDEQDWAKTSTGSSGSGEYSWESKPKGTAPMLRIGLGVASSTYQAAPAQGQLTSNLGDVSFIDYSGPAMRIEFVGGYFLSESFAVHAGLVINYLLLPVNDLQFHDDAQDAVVRDSDDGVYSAGFTQVTAGASGYIPGNLFLSGSFGLALGSVDDEGLDVLIGPGWSFNVLLGKDFKISDQFALGLGAYLDVASQPTDAGFRMAGASLGLQTHGTIRFR